MIDQIRRDIQHRLDQLLAEADKLRRALVALGSSDGAGAKAESSAPSPAPAKPARPARRARAARQASSGSSARAASGATKSAVLSALAGGKAMTAGEVASATGLGRASVSTTLSKLAKSGEVAKADRGYQLTKS